MPNTLSIVLESLYVIAGFGSFLFVMLFQFSRWKPSAELFGAAMTTQVIVFVTAFLAMGFATTAPWSNLEATILVISFFYLPIIIASPVFVRWLRKQS